MKKIGRIIVTTIILFCLTSNKVHAAQQVNEIKQNTERNEPIVIEITGEKEIREYLDANGEEYDPSLIAVKRIFYNDVFKSYNNESTEMTRLFEYYITNKLEKIYTDTSIILKRYNRPAGHVLISEGVQISNVISADATVPLEYLEFELGYSLTAIQTFQINWDASYNYPVTIEVYPIYEEISGFVYEDDVWYDDYLGYFIAKRALGDDIRVYAQ